MSTINVNSFTPYNNYGKTVDIKREWASINMDATNVGTGYVGYIIPIFNREMIPGQTIDLQTNIGLQFVPFVSNLMHTMYATIKYFFVPYRLLDTNWEDFIMGGIDGTNTYQMPHIDLKQLKTATSTDPKNQSLVHTIIDYLGYPIHNDFQELPQDNNTMVKAAAYPVYAYNKIYNDHYRNPDIEPTETDKMNIKTKPCLWQFDYFTRGQVYQQRGTVPIVPITNANQMTLKHTINTNVGAIAATGAAENKSVSPFWNMMTGNKEGQQSLSNMEGKLFDGTIYAGRAYDGSANKVNRTYHRDVTTIIADHDLNLEQMGINLNDLMVSMGIMAVLINNAKITYRYIDFLEIRYGIKRQDARLQMSEYINTQEFQIDSQGITQLGYGDVAQGQTPQGHITAQASGMGSAHTKYEAQEHGIIMAMLEIKPATAYCQGLPRLLQTKTRYEFATPELANMPDRETQKAELYYTQTANDKTGFNWTGMYNEYRTMYNTVSGLVRPDTPIPQQGSILSPGLYSYSLAKLFSEAPVFNLEFIQCQADMNRIKQYTKEPDFIFILKNTVNTSIPLPLIPNPAQLLNL